MVFPYDDRKSELTALSSSALFRGVDQTRLLPLAAALALRRESYRPGQLILGLVLALAGCGRVDEAELADYAEARITVSGLADEDIAISVADLAQLEAVSRPASATRSNGEKVKITAVGPLLDTFLAAYGHQQTDFDHIRFGASDGYAITVEHNLLANRELILALMDGGSALSADDQPLRLVFGQTDVSTVEGSRSAKWVHTLAVTLGGAPPKGVYLEADSLKLKVGSTYRLSAQVEKGDEGTDTRVTWSSSDESVATVDENGNLTVVGKGEAVITVTTVSGQLTDSLTVNAAGEAEKDEGPDPAETPTDMTGLTAAAQIYKVRLGGQATAAQEEAAVQNWRHQAMAEDATALAQAEPDPQVRRYTQLLLSSLFLIGVAGYSNGAIIENCVNLAGIISNSSYAAGIAGYVAGGGQITDCQNRADVSGGSNTGGIAGYINNGVVEGCINNGAISGSSTVGGVAGYAANAASRFTECANLGDVTGSGNNVGGITGQMATANSLIERCYNQGAIKGSAYVGGIVGTNAAKLSDCYNQGAVSGSSTSASVWMSSGGIAGSGSANSAYTNTYNSGAVSAANGMASAIVSASNNAAFAITNSYWLEGTADQAYLERTAGRVTADKVAVKSDAELKALAPTLGASFKAGATYPILTWQPDELFDFTAPANITVTGGVEGGQVTAGRDVTFTLDAETAAKVAAGKAAVTYSVGSGDPQTLTPDENGVFTIPGADIKASVKVSVAVNNSTAGGGNSPTPVPTPTFRDVPASHWAHEFVAEMAVKGFIKGKPVGPELLFGPDDNVTRAEFVTILARMSREALPSGGKASSKFGDIMADAYYAPAVAWAADAGVVMGTGGNAFSPDRPISRQEIATMIYRYAAYKRIALSGSAAPASFSDADLIAAYAKDAVSSMQQAGVINGYGDGSFRPLGYTTRAETAKLLCLIWRLDK